MRVALYARVSTLNIKIPVQLTELREYAGRREWQISQEYVDQGVSGSHESRPAFNRLMSDAKCRRFDAILGLEDRPVRTIAKATSELARRTRGTRRRVRESPGQS